MTTHNNTNPELSDDLVARFASVSTATQVAPGDIEQVKARGRQRNRRQRAGGVVAAVVLLAGGAALATNLSAPQPPAIVTPVPSVTDGVVPSEEVLGTDEITEPTTKEPVTVGSLSHRDFVWHHIRYSEAGITYRAEGRTTEVTTDSVYKAIARRGTGLVVYQEDWGSPIEIVGTGDTAGLSDTLAPAARGQRLLSVDATHAYFTARSGQEGVEGDDNEHLFRVDAAIGGDVVDLGVSGLSESFTDELVVGRNGAVWLGCHLQCTMHAGSIEQLLDDDVSEGPDLPGGWLYGLAVSADETTALTVRGPDPTLDPDGTAEVLRVDLSTGDVEVLAELPRTAGRIEFTPSESGIVVSNPDVAWLVDNLDEPVRRVREISGSAGLSMNGAHDGQDEPDASVAVVRYDSMLWPEVGAGASAADSAEAREDSANDWRRQPEDVVRRFAAQELGWDASVVEVLEAADAFDVDHQTAARTSLSLARSSDDGERVHRVELYRPAMSPFWWITSGDDPNDAGPEGEGGGEYLGGWDFYIDADRNGGIRLLDGRMPEGSSVALEVVGESGNRVVSGRDMSTGPTTFTAEIRAPFQATESVRLLLTARRDGEVVGFSLRALWAGAFLSP